MGTRERGPVSEHTPTETHWTTTDTRRSWHACACGATWIATTGKPGRCPNDREEPPQP